MNDRPNRYPERQIHLPRRFAMTGVAALAALLLLAATVASLAQASDAVSAARDVIPPAITNPHIIESSNYLSAAGTTLYYGNGMPNSQSFWLAGDAEGSQLFRVVCAEAFGEGPFNDYSPEDGWECGSYRVSSSDEGDGVITATLYNITGDSDVELFYYFEDLLAPDSAASSPAYANALPITVGWTAVDTESGPADTCLWVSFEGGGWSNTGLCQPGTAGTYPYDPGVAPDGTYYFQTVSVDHVHNYEAPASGTGDSATLLDTVDPIATVDAPTSTGRLYWEVQWPAVDPSPGSGIDFYDVSYRVDTGAWDFWLQGTDSISATFGPYLPVPVHGGHSYGFQVRAYDRAGNVSESPVVTTMVKIPPLCVPVLVRNYAPLTNGGFEAGWAGWTHGGQLARSISMEDTHSGSYAALLGNPAYPCDGGVPLGSAWLQRTFMVPSSGVSTLRIWYRIWSEDTLAADQFDRFEIWVNGSFAFRDGNDSGIFGCDNDPQSDGWEYYDVDVTDLTGTNITLRLENWNWSYDPTSPGYDWFNTWTYVDDIQLLP
jgi:hypothetical protein